MRSRFVILFACSAVALSTFFAGVAWERARIERQDAADAHSPGNQPSPPLLEAPKPGTPRSAPLSLRGLLRDGMEADRRTARARVHAALEEASERELAGLVQELSALRHPSREERQLMRAVYRRWAEHDPTAALAALPTIHDFETRRRVVHTALAVLAERDFEAAKASLATVQAGELQQLAVEAIVEGRRDADVTATLAWAESLSDPLRLRAIRETVARWSDDDPAAAVGYAQALPASESTNELLHDLIRGWARSEPIAAVDLAQSLPPSERTRETMHEIARAWAADDPEAAVQWANTLSDITYWRSSIDGIAAEIAQVDPERAASLANSVEDRELKDGVLNTVANTWSQQNLADASAWVQGLPPRDRLAASSGLLGSVAESDPAAAAALFDNLATGLQGADSGDQLRDMAAEIAERWSAFDLAEAASWSRGLSLEDEVQHTAMEVVADRWVQADAQRAQQWILDLPQGRPRDVATERLVDHLSGTDPVSALAWTMTVTEPEHQTDMLHHVFERWRERDPAAARQSFEQTVIPPEQREHLAEIFE